MLHARVRAVEVAAPHRVRFRLHQPWPDCMTYDGPLTAGAWGVVPTRYLGQGGDDGFRRHPLGFGPDKSVSHRPGVALGMEAAAPSWSKVPHVQRLVCRRVPVSARYGNAATRLEEAAFSAGAFACGGDPDIDAPFKRQDVETERARREALRRLIRQRMHERVMCGPLGRYGWPSGIGPRVEEPALRGINPLPWAAPLKDVRLKAG